MKITSHFCLAAFLLTRAMSAGAADFPAELKALQTSSSPGDVQAFIAKSYETGKTDPDYFVASANYYWNLSLEPNVSTKPAAPGEFVVADPKTGQAVGSISTSAEMDPSLRQKAVALLTEAHQRFPHRLDIGMGLAHLQREMKDPSASCTTLLGILKYAPKNEAGLQWKNGTPLPEPAAAYIPQLMQGYTAPFFRLDTKEGDALCRKLCEGVIAAYPDSPYAYNMLAALSDAQGDKKAAIQHLLAAHQKAPKDALVLFNLATTYRAIGDTASAVKYFQQVIALNPDDELKTAAQTAITELR